MKITEIKIEQNKNLGNYESRKLGFSAVLDEHEKSEKCIADLKLFLDWHLNIEERESQAKQYRTEIDSGKLADAEKVKKEKWLNIYNETKAKVEALNL